MEKVGRRSSIPHVSALDGARGAAVAGVLLFHGGHLVGGYLGVDFFFTLSGFLITSLLLAEAARTGGDRAGRVLGPTGPPAAPRVGRADGRHRVVLPVRRDTAGPGPDPR